MSDIKKIDAVITWVNSSDEGWIEKYNKFNENIITQKARFRSNGEIFYLIKLIRKNMEFIDNIYVVTSCEKLTDDKIFDEKVIVIHHDQIAPEHIPLPTFSSTIIESFIHNIKDLSNHFIYFNDDFFPVKEVPYEFYFPNNNSANIYLDLPIADSIKSNNFWSAKLNRTNIWLKELYGDNNYLKLPHMPNLYNRIICKNFICKVSEVIDLMKKSRFRTNVDVQIRLGLTYAHIFSNDQIQYNAIRSDTSELVHCPMNPGNYHDFSLELKNLLNNRPYFLSIQDNLEDDDKFINNYISSMNEFFTNIIQSTTTTN